MGTIATKLIYNVGIMFIMMIPGIILKRYRFIQDGFGKGLSNLVLYIAQPALIFLAYLKEFDSNVLKNILIVLAFSIVAHLVFAMVALKAYKHEPDGRRRMLRFATVFSNAAFMGIPLVEKVLGSDALIYASVYNITFNLFLWSFGVYICTEDRDEDGDGVTDGDVLTDYHEIKKQNPLFKSLKTAVLHPVTIAALIGLVFFFLPIHTYVPELVVESLTHLKGLVIPLSMMVIGLRLSDIDFHGILKEKSMYLFLILRHAALPVLVYVIMKIMTMTGVVISTEVMLVILMMASAPAASSATMFAERYDCDAPYVSKLVTVSTLLSILTMPLITMLAYL